jgi:hypothetical protein
MSALPDLRKLVTRLANEDPQVRDLAASEIGDLLEADVVHPPEFRWLMPILIDRAVAEKDLTVKESLLFALASASAEKLSGNVNLDPIAADIHQFDVACLDHALDILGFSGNARYRKVIKAFLTHPDESVRRAATDALEVLDAIGRQRRKAAARQPKPGTPKTKAL